jgi:tRNA G46 methylase TrmB
MQAFEALFDDYLNQSGAAQVKAAQDITALVDAVDLLCGMLDGANRRAALALLARCAKKQTHRQRLVDQPVERLAACLSDYDAKTRKNAAVLLGSIGNEAYAVHLVEALKAETQQFVRPSIILALGALGGDAAKAAVLSLGEPEGDDKHAREERDAIQKAKSRLAGSNLRSFISLKKAMEVWLAPVSGLEDALVCEGEAKGIPLSLKSGFAVVKTADYASLFGLRCFYEALLPVASGIAFEPAAFAGALAGKKVYELLCSMHGVNGPFRLRLELRVDNVDRGAFASAFFFELPSDRFQNAPSNYDVELRAIQKDGAATLLLRLFGFHDPRFNYRLAAVPASMHPAAAAAVLFAHRDVMRPNHRVLDPFCGAGTLLAERTKLMGARSIIGLDISRDAWQIARANLAAAGIHAKVYNRDCRGFECKEKVNEILCNLPFGHRVGSHTDNRKLYEDILREWPDLLEKDGFALAITNDKLLFEESVRPSAFYIARRTGFAYGGLSPTAYLLRLKDRR